MSRRGQTEIVLLSSGHTALDHRVFDKEALTLAQHFPRVRVVAAHRMDEMRQQVQITALPPARSRWQRFVMRPLQCFLAARGTGRRILILHDAELLAWVPLVRMFTRWQVIYDVHEDFAQLLLRRTWLPRALRRGLGYGLGVTEKLLARGCSGIMGATAVLADYFAPLPRVALYNLPSRKFISRAAACARPLAEREYDLVHLGTLSRERLDFLCAVLAELFARKPMARVLVIGVEGELQACLQRQFPPTRVTVLGKVGYDRIAEYLGNCRIGIDVHPILYPHLRCAVPVKVFEYMAAGCNVVTSFLPEMHRVLGDEGMEHVTTIYTPSAEAFADEIARLLEETAFMVEHQTALLRLIDSRWNWEHEGEKLVQFIRSYYRGEEAVCSEQVLDH